MRVGDVTNMHEEDDKAPENDDERVDIADPFAKRLMVRYLGRREADLESLRSALAENDFDRIRIKGHNLYGSGSAYGLDRISELGNSLEAAAICKDQGAIARQIDALESYVRRLRIT